MANDKDPEYPVCNSSTWRFWIFALAGELFQLWNELSPADLKSSTELKSPGGYKEFMLEIRVGPCNYVPNPIMRR